MNLFDLDEIILMDIFEFLDTRDLFNISSISEKFIEPIKRRLKCGFKFDMDELSSFTEFVEFFTKFASAIVNIKFTGENEQTRFKWYEHPTFVSLIESLRDNQIVEAEISPSEHYRVLWPKLKNAKKLTTVLKFCEAKEFNEMIKELKVIENLNVSGFLERINWDGLCSVKFLTLRPKVLRLLESEYEKCLVKIGKNLVKLDVDDRYWFPLVPQLVQFAPNLQFLSIRVHGCYYCQ